MCENWQIWFRLKNKLYIHEDLNKSTESYYV